MKRVPVRVKASAAVFAAAAALLVTASPAHAGTFKVTSNCDVPWVSCSDEPELWELYNSKANSTSGGSYTTSWAEFWGDVYDYEGTSEYQGSTLETYRYVFNGNGSGSGQYVKNNAGSAQNCSEVNNYRVYYNSGYAGHSEYFGARDAYADCVWHDLDSTLKNNEASQHFA
ncbi:hypothetical protein ACGF3G_29140 [Streptomyces sp. NPDC048179]|uniref:hypothetical protein n=1 Tax=Streptomyces sp. NPDC048179 TaxID=3365506 RepID=UPI00371C71DA